MAIRSLITALVLGAVQGVFEWLPISSEGNITLALTSIGADPTAAVQLSLFLHGGTAVAATAYYRDEIAALLPVAASWRPGNALDGDRAELTFLAAATLISGAVGVASYALLIDLASALAGGAFVALIGGLLVVTGIVQRVAEGRGVERRERPTPVDALLVGVGQGLAILPGISRSGSTISLLLLRGHQGEEAFSLSFLLSIPAALGGAAITVLDTGGLPGIDPLPAVVALATAAVVGYLTIGALMRVVRGLAFWAVCVAIGFLAIVGGVLVVL